MSAIKIHSSRVILLEGTADEFVLNAEPAEDMHGFAIMVPPGEGGERLLDMLWRITMVYAGMPSLLASRAKVRKMVEAVMSKESRKLKPARHPARKSGLANVTRTDKVAFVGAPIGLDPAPNDEVLSAVAKTKSLAVPKGGRKAKTRYRN